MTILSVGCKVLPLSGEYKGQEGVITYYNPWTKIYHVKFEGKGRPLYEYYEEKDLKKADGEH